MAVSGRVNAGVIVYRFNSRKLEVLLVHQSDKRPEVWSIPKGGLKNSENIAQAARRELMEETALNLHELDFLGYVDYAKINKRLYCFMAEAPDETKIKCRAPEIDAAGFFKIAQAKKMVEKRQRVLLTTLQKIMTFSLRRGA